MPLFKLILSSCLVLSVLAVATEDGDLQLTADPSQIGLGLLNSLNVNCTFSTTDNGNIVSLISLTLSRAKSPNENDSDVAMINVFSGHQVNNVTTERYEEDAFFDSAAVSFLNLRWEYPTKEQVGQYRCTAKGMDKFGRFTVVQRDVHVTAFEPNLDEYKKRVRYMDTEMKKFKKAYAELENNTDTSKLEACTKNLKNTVSFLFEDPLTYNHHKYVISKFPFTNINESVAICQATGGHLVEIDSVGEYKAIQNFLKSTKGFSSLIIAGTDEAVEGTWVFPSNSQPIPYVDWSPGNSDEGRSSNCLGLAKYINEWRMWDIHCNSVSPSFSVRYMCEISTYDSKDGSEY